METLKYLHGRYYHGSLCLTFEKEKIEKRRIELKGPGWYIFQRCLHPIFSVKVGSLRPIFLSTENKQGRRREAKAILHPIFSRQKIPPNYQEKQGVRSLQLGAFYPIFSGKKIMGNYLEKIGCKIAAAQCLLPYFFQVVA